MHVQWTKGGGADVSRLDDDRIALLSTIPSAPGSRIEGALATGEPIRVKVVRCKKQESRFFLEGRLIDATREFRNLVETLALPATEDGSVGAPTDARAATAEPTPGG